MALRSMFDTTSVRYAALAVVGCVVVVVGVTGYRWYRGQQEEKAQEVFSSCMREFDRAEQDATLWPNAELVFRLGLEQNKNTAMAPYFLAYQAEALMNMGKFTQALDSMGQAVAAMPSSSSLYTLYATKYALMMMDATEPDLQQQGYESLTRLAQDTTNKTRDRALYYLGLYHWSQDDVQKAGAVWSELTPLATVDPASPWAQLAVEKIEHIIA